MEYGERKAGKPDDAYVLFGERLKRGYYDAYFVALGLRHAYWQIADPPVPLSGKQR